MCRIFEFSKNYIIFILLFFPRTKLRQQTGQRQLIEKKILRNIRKFDTYQIAFLMTCQRNKSIDQVFSINQNKFCFVVAVVFFLLKLG